MADRAAAGGGVAVPLTTTGLINQANRDPNAGIQTGGPEDWFGPGNPMRPQAPPEVRGRVLDFPSAYNLNQRPRAYEPIEFHTLRNLASSYDVLRTVIETRKDQVAALTWNIAPKDPTVKVGKSGPLRDRILAAEAFFESPDLEHDWDTWVRMLLEDLFVIDAPTIFPHLTRGGDLYRLKVLDGGTIKRVIDDWGDTPQAPSPAYQQYLKGMAAVNYTRDQLIYRPRNRRANKIYGFSPVEQIVAIINIGIRRETWQLEFFRSGTLPDALIGTPNEWTPDQIRSFQDWFDARQNDANRRGATFVPGEVAKGYVPTKTEELFGKAEEWIARVICFAFSISPQAFSQMMNRATAATAKDTAKEEGVQPVKKWLKSLIDFILRTYMKSPDLALKWLDEEELDPATKNEILDAKVKSGRMTLNESRDADGLDPYGSDVPEANMPLVYTATGFVPLSVAKQIEQSQQKQEAFGVAAPVGAGGGEQLEPGQAGAHNGDDQTPPGAHATPGGSNGGPPLDGPKPPKPKSPGQQAAEADSKAAAAHVHGAGCDHGRVVKRTAHDGKVTSWRRIDDPPSATRPLARRSKVAISKAVKAAFGTAADDVAHQIEQKLKAAEKAGRAVVVRKAEDDHSNPDATVTDLTAVTVDDLMKDLDLSSLTTMKDAVEEALYDLASDTATKALAQIGVKVEGDLVDQVNDRAVAFARERAAELVGKRVQADGTVVDNPNAAWSITDATRDMIRKTIADGLADNLGTQGIADAIQESYGFSEDRADLVARTEVANANEQAKLDGWREAQGQGFTIKKSWQTSNNDNTCPVCSANEDQGPIDVEDDFDSGDDAAPAHPECECVTVPEVEMDDDADSSGETPGEDDDDEG